MKKIETLTIIWDQNLWGGVDSHLAYLLNSKSFEKISVTIFSNKGNQGIARLKKLLKNNIKFKYYKNILSPKIENSVIKKIIFLIKPLLFLISFVRFKILFSREKSDVFLAQCGGYGTFREEQAALLAVNKSNFKIISMVIHHACIFSPSFTNFFLRIINHYLSKKLSSLINISKATRDSVFFKSNLLDNQLLQSLVIHNGIEVRNHIKKKNNDNNKFLKIGLVSRIEKYKGHEDLLSAITLLPKSYIEKFKFYFIGGGEKKEIDNLSNMISKTNLKETVHLKGYIDKHISEIIEEFDLTLSLTRTFEGFGLSIAESITLEIPVITTDVGAIKEYLNKDMCEIIDPSSPEQIKDALINFCDNKEKWKTRAAKAKLFLDKNYNAEIMANKYLKHFNDKLRYEL